MKNFYDKDDYGYDLFEVYDEDIDNMSEEDIGLTDSEFNEIVQQIIVELGWAEDFDIKI